MRQCYTKSVTRRKRSPCLRCYLFNDRNLYAEVCQQNSCLGFDKGTLVRSLFQGQHAFDTRYGLVWTTIVYLPRCRPKNLPHEKKKTPSLLSNDRCHTIQPLGHDLANDAMPCKMQTNPAGKTTATLPLFLCTV